MPAPKKASSSRTRKTTTRKTTPRKKAAPKPAEEATVDLLATDAESTVEARTEAPTPSQATPEEKAAKTEAYHTLKSAGVEIPAELAIVETWIAEAQAVHAEQEARRAAAEQEHQRQVAEANVNGPWYVRNGTRTQFNIRLDRQTEKRRIQLKPRGEPGDLHPLKDEDLNDPVLRQNVGLGLCEVIPAGEAADIVNNQTHNMGNRVHTPLSVLTNERGEVLTNERGEAYKNGAVRVEAEFNSQGVTVAQLDPRAMQGQMHDRELKQTGALTRTNPGQPQVQAPSSQPQEYVSSFVPTGGQPAAIIPGPQNQIQVDIANRARAQREAQLHAGPGELKVSVDPVQRT